MYKIEVKFKDGISERTLGCLSDYCSFENIDNTMWDITTKIKDELHFDALYERIVRKELELKSANIEAKALLLSPDAADYLSDRGCNQTATKNGRISTFRGLTVYVLPYLKDDFMIGVDNG